MSKPGSRGLSYALADLALLALAGYLASQVAQRLLLPASATFAGGAAAGDADVVANGQERKPPPGGQASLVDAITSRNLFGSRMDTPGSGTESGAALPSFSPLPVQLMGTVVDLGGGRSFAILDDTEARKQLLLFVGESLRPGILLKEVARNRAVFVREGREEVVERAREGGKAPPPPGPPRTASQGGGDGGKALTAEPDLNVRRTGENSFVVDRRELDGAVGNLTTLASQVRLVPNFTEGKSDGFRVFNIRPNSIFGKLGLANGDVIRRVNGLEISGAEQALQAFTQLREASDITLDLSRANRNLTLQFEVR
jgi:general secretion pathway protein C